jgi:ribulose-bisphosphate carboxylase small chain
MWGNPMFDLRDAAGAMGEVLACRKAHGNAYIRVNAFDSSRGFETTRLSFIVNRPAEEPGFLLKRHEVAGRQIQYTIESYAAARAPEGRRYE